MCYHTAISSRIGLHAAPHAPVVASNRGILISTSLLLSLSTLDSSLSGEIQVSSAVVSALDRAVWVGFHARLGPTPLKGCQGLMDTLDHWPAEPNLPMPQQPTVLLSHTKAPPKASIVVTPCWLSRSLRITSANMGIAPPSSQIFDLALKTPGKTP